MSWWRWGGGIVASGSYDSTVKFWDLRAKNAHKPVQELRHFKDSVTSMIMPETVNEEQTFGKREKKGSIQNNIITSTSTYEFIAASVDCTVRTYDLRMGELKTDEFPSPVTGVALSRDGKCLAASLLDGRIGLVERETGEVLNTYEGHKAGNYSLGVDFLIDEGRLVSCSEDGKCYIYDLVTRHAETLGEGLGGAVIDVATHPSKNLLLTANSKDKFVTCYRGKN